MFVTNLFGPSFLFFHVLLLLLIPYLSFPRQMKEQTSYLLIYLKHRPENQNTYPLFDVEKLKFNIPLHSALDGQVDAVPLVRREGKRGRGEGGEGIVGCYLWLWKKESPYDFS